MPGPRKKQKPRHYARRRWRLKLVIKEVENFQDDKEFNGYDLTNSKPWPLCDYTSEGKAIYARNCMVVPEQGPQTEAIRQARTEKETGGILRVG